MAWSWEKSSLNPKNWGGGSSSSSVSLPSIDTDSAVSAVVNEGGTRTYTGGIKDDLTMGFATFGLGGEAQAEKLSELGYSQGAIEDFQARTAETKANPPSFPKDDKPARVAGTATEEVPEETVSETQAAIDEQTTQIQNLAEDIATGSGMTDESKVTAEASEGTAAGGKARKTAAKSTGPSEDKAIEYMTKGRGSTILTKPRGLTITEEETDDPRLRKKRSLLAG